MRIHPVPLALAAAGLLLAPPTNAVTFNVSSPFDSPDSSPGDGLCHADIGVCTLRAAIQETNALAGADEIVLAAGTYTFTRSGRDENDSVTGDLDIFDSLTLTGAGPSRTIIDADSFDRVIEVIGHSSTETHVTLRGLQLAHGLLLAGASMDEGGAGLRVRGDAWLDLQNCRLHGHRAPSTLAYAVADSGSRRLHLESTEIDDCRRTAGAAKDGATVYIYPYDSDADYRLQDCWLHGNDGAGLDFGSNTLTMVGTTIELQGGRGIVHSGYLYLTSSTLAANQDGGILSSSLGPTAGTFAVNSTISGNRAYADGGGLLVGHHAVAVLSSVTITDNIADGDQDGAGDGGGVWVLDTGQLRLRHTILGGNQDWSSPFTVHPDCHGTIESEGYNLIGNAIGCTITGDTGGNINGAQPGLGPLVRQGGTTPTHVPLFDSVVLDRGAEGCSDVNGSALATDQRGYPREIDGDQEQGDECDLGAAERNYRMLFQDGFESGTCWAWNATVGY